MPDDLNAIMERASTALQAMDYTGCEAACLEALAIARQGHRWADYARILLPLQETRRQRRMIAVEGTIRLGSWGLSGPPSCWLEQLAPGCIVVTTPHAKTAAAKLHAAARRGHHCVEVLYATADATGTTWTCSTFRGPAFHDTRPAPDDTWTDRWVRPVGAGTPIPAEEAGTSSPGNPVKSAADWFVDAAEAIGDAALASLATDADLDQRLQALEQCLDGADTHEILHQRLGETARALARADHA